MIQSVGTAAHFRDGEDVPLSFGDDCGEFRVDSGEDGGCFVGAGEGGDVLYYDFAGSGEAGWVGWDDGGFARLGLRLGFGCILWRIGDVRECADCCSEGSLSTI